MNIQKSTIKIAVASGIGADVEDRMDGELQSKYQLEGASMALAQAAVKIPRDLAAKLDTALEEGEYEDVLDPRKAVQLAKKYLAKAGQYLAAMADEERKKVVIAQGRIVGLQDAIKIIQKIRDTESKQLQAALESVEDNGEPPRTAAEVARKEHGSVADRRLKEIAVKDASLVCECGEKKVDVEGQLVCPVCLV